jgi:chromosome segregation ATPase
MFRKLSLTGVAMTAMALLVVAPGVVNAQSADAQQNRQGQTQDHMTAAKSMMNAADHGSKTDCQQMQAKMTAMRAEREQMQAKLDELEAKVEQTTGAKQQAAMAELLTTMVDQRRAMNGMMSEMQTMMTGHMADNSQSDAATQPASSGGMSGGSMMNGSMMNGSSAEGGRGKTVH